MVSTPPAKYLLYPCWCDDVSSHVNISEKDIFAHCGNRSQSLNAARSLMVWVIWKWPLELSKYREKAICVQSLSPL